MWNTVIVSSLLAFSLKLVQGIGNRASLLNNQYQIPQRRVVQEIQVSPRYLRAGLHRPINSPERRPGFLNERRTVSPIRQPRLQLKALPRQFLLRGNYRPVRYPMPHYLSSLRSSRPAIAGRIRVPPAIKRTRPAPTRTLIRLTPIGSLQPKQRYAIALWSNPRARYRPVSALPVRRVHMGLPLGSAVHARPQPYLRGGRDPLRQVNQRFQVMQARAGQGHAGIRPSLPHLVTPKPVGPAQQRYKVINAHPLPSRYLPLHGRPKQEVVAQQRQSVPYTDRRKSIADRIRNALMWKKYLRAEHNPYANQIAKRISFQALRRTSNAQRPSIAAKLAQRQASYVRGLQPLPRQMQSSYNTQYSVSGTSSNSGTNSNTVLKGPGHTQTNNHVKVTQNTGVRRFAPHPAIPSARYYRQRAQVLRNRQLQSSARAKANAKVKASASTGAASSSGSSSGKVNPPSRTSPPQSRGSGGYGYGAGYGWGSSGGGGFGYGGGGSNGYPGIPFPYGFGGFPYIPGFPGGGASTGSSSGGSKSNKYLVQNRKKKVAPVNLIQKGKRISTAYKPASAPAKTVKVIRKPTAGPAKATLTGRGFQGPPGRAALNFKYYSTDSGSRSPGGNDVYTNQAISNAISDMMRGVL